MCRKILSVSKHFVDLVQWYGYVDMHPTGLILTPLESRNIPMPSWGEMRGNCLLTNTIYRMKTGLYYWNPFRLFTPLKTPDNIFLVAFPHLSTSLTLPLPSKLGSLILPFTLSPPAPQMGLSDPLGFWASCACLSFYHLSIMAKTIYFPFSRNDPFPSL